MSYKSWFPANNYLIILSQSFIGHSSAVSGILLTPDNSTVVSVGDSIIYWDFLAYSTHEQREAMNKQMLKGRALENMRGQPVAIIRETEAVDKPKNGNPNTLKNVTDISRVNVLSEIHGEETRSAAKVIFIPNQIILLVIIIFIKSFEVKVKIFL